MAPIAPLTPLHYPPELLPEVIAPPYDVVGPAERAKLAARSPFNVVHVDIPEGEGGQRYARAAQIFDDWQKSTLMRAGAPAFWLRTVRTPPPGGVKCWVSV